MSRQIHIHRRGIYLLPNLFTLASLFAAFYALVAAVDGRFAHAAVAVFVSLLFDGLDGRVARLINAQSAFGAELDSICDMVAFGVVPAVIVLLWSLPVLQHYHWQKLGWIVAFIYVACTALRLARFNVPMTNPTKSKLAKRYFFGLPCPAAAALLASLIGLTHSLHLRGNMFVTIIVVLLMLCAGVLMVSNIRYRSFKDIDVKARISFVKLLLMLLILALIVFKPVYSVLVIMLIYVLSGPVVFALTWHRRGAKHGG